MRRILPVAIVLLLILLGAYGIYLRLFPSQMAKKQTGSSPVIGFSLGTVKEERWQRDLDAFTKKAESLGAKVNVLIANADSNLQVSQIDNLILQNVSVLVIVPEDDKSVAPLVAKAQEKGIKVIAYDRLVSNANIDAYVTVDYVKAGEQQAHGVFDVAKKGNFAVVMGASDDTTVYMQKDGIANILQSAITAGTVKIVYQDFTENWKPEIAYQNIKKLLAKNTKLDGVVAMNDGTAGGVIQALKEKGLDGKIPVSGMDAELAACQRIVEGTQTQTSYLPISLQAQKAADVAVALAEGKNVPPDGKTKNGTFSIPTYFVQPISVTKQNMMDTIIKDGFHTYEEVYRNVPVGSRPQK